MKFTFYDSNDDANEASFNTGLHIYYNDEHVIEACYGSFDCTSCPFKQLDCDTLLLSFAEPGTSIDITIETHPELFV